VPPHARAGQLRTRAPLRSLSPVFGGLEARSRVTRTSVVQRRIGPAWRRFAVLYFALLALAMVGVFTFAGQVYWSWVERFEGPELQKRFGFVAERRQIRQGFWNGE
jgi:hypothetical protein